jgi:hypothetical protein
MSAIRIKGKIVSLDKYSGTNKSTGKPFTVHTAYVVNGGGAPQMLKILGDNNPYKVGQELDVEVTCSVYAGDIQFYPVQRGSN